MNWHAVTRRVGRIPAALNRWTGWEGRRRWLELHAILAVQAGLAAAVAWTIAHEVLGRPSPVFAPTAAVGAIAASVGPRTRRAGEMLVGVVAGILVGDLLKSFMGTGPWQTAVIVSLALIVALVISGGGQVVGQAGASAVLIATLTPDQPGAIEVPRIIDATVGGTTAIVVLAILPVNPIGIVQRAARPVFAVLIDQLHTIADGMDQGNADSITQALEELRGLESRLSRLSDAVSGAGEAIAISPVRWHRRRDFARYRRGAEYLKRTILASQEMTRRAATAIRDGEPMPTPLPGAVHQLGDAVSLLQLGAESNYGTERSQKGIKRAVQRASRAYEEGVGFSGSVVVAQIRTMATDLLQATGVDEAEARRQIRERFEAIGRSEGEGRQ